MCWFRSSARNRRPARRGPDQGRGGRRQSTRRHAAERRVPATARRFGHPRPRGGRHGRQRRCGRSHLAARRSRLCPRRGWRYAEYLRGAGAAMPAGTGPHRLDTRRRDSRDLLHGLDQRLRARPSRGRRVRARSRRVEWHRHDGDPAGARVRRARLRHGRLRREMRGLRATRRRARDQLPRAGLRRGDSRPDRRAWRRSDSRHGRRRVPAA